MKILYYSRQINGDNGAGVHGRQFYKTAIENGINITCYPPLNNETISMSPFAKRHKFVSRISPTLSEIASCCKGNFESINAYKNIAQIHNEKKFDIVLMRLQNIDWACKKLCDKYSIPFVLEINSPLNFESTQLYGKSKLNLLGSFEKSIIKSARHIITVSNSLKEYISGFGVNHENISVNPNGVDVSRFNPAIDGRYLRKKLGVEKKKIIIFSGSSMPWHDVEILIRILPRLPNNLIFLIIGDSPYLRNLIALSENANVLNRVVFTGHIPYDEVPQYLSIGDICLATYKPSSFFYFSPIKILEYMAMGKPIIATDIGQIRELLGEGKGILIPPGDDEILLKSIHQLIFSGSNQEMGKLARESVVGNYTWNHNVKRVIEACETMMI